MKFLEGDAQPETNTKSGKWPMKRVEQACMHRLTRLYETTEADVLDSARHVAKDGL